VQQDEKQPISKMQSVAQHNKDWRGYEDAYRHEQLWLQQQRAREDEERRDAKAASLALLNNNTLRGDPCSGAACCESRETLSNSLACQPGSGTVSSSGSTHAMQGLHPSADPLVGNTPASKPQMTTPQVNTTRAEYSSSNSLQALQTQPAQGAPLTGVNPSAESAATAPRCDVTPVEQLYAFRAPSGWLAPVREMHPYEEDRYIRELAVYEAAGEAQHMRPVAEMLMQAAINQHQQRQQQQQGPAACGSGSTCKLQGGTGSDPKATSAAGEVHTEAEQDCRSFRDLLRKSSKKIKKMVKSLSGKKKAVQPVAVGASST
jgi:hypothetical protein